MEIKFRDMQPGDHYMLLAGSDPFSTATNKKILDFWGRTGNSLDPAFAMLEVLAEFFNEHHEMKNGNIVRKNKNA